MSGEFIDVLVPVPLLEKFTYRLTKNQVNEELTNKYKGKVRVLKAPCMGKCDYAPALEVEHNHVDNATIDKVDQVITSKSFHPVISKFIDLENYISNGGYSLFKKLKSKELYKLNIEINSKKLRKNSKKGIFQ